MVTQDNNMKKLLIMCFVYCLYCISPVFAGEPGFLEITKAEKKQKGVVAETYKAGEVIPGMSVEGGAAKVGDKIAVGQRVSVPRDIFVTFTSSNGNIVETKTQVVETKTQIIETKTQVVEKTVETKTQTVFIVGNIIPEGESYIQNEGWIRYSVIQKAIEFFNVYHNKYLAAVEGTVFEVNVDLQKKEIEFTAEQGDVSVTREIKVKAGDKEIEGLKEVVIISGRNGKTHSVKYDLSVEEAFKIFKNYEDVLTYFKEQLKKDEKEGDHLKILIAKNNIGMTLHYLARYDEAIELFGGLLEKALDLKSESWIGTIQSNLGAAWHSKGKYDKAVEYFEKALKILLKVFGEYHPNVASTYNNLGSAWHYKGEYDKALEYYEKALNIFTKVLGNEHPNVAAYYNNLGAAWHSKGEYDKAIEYFEKALNIDLKVFGNEHPNVATDYNNLGVAWRAKGEYDKAIEYYEKALKIDLKVFGNEHPNVPNVARDYNNLGAAWYSKGEYEKAIEYYEKALNIDLKVFGNDHPHVATQYNNLGLAWHDKGEYDKALEYFEKALKIFNKFLGPDHPHTKTVEEHIRNLKEIEKTSYPKSHKIGGHACCFISTAID